MDGFFLSEENAQKSSSISLFKRYDSLIYNKVENSIGKISQTGTD